MTLPFEPRPDSPDADHLNTLLDAMRSGSRAPDAASAETDEATALANAAGQLRGLVRRADAPATAYLQDHPLHDRWEDIMTTAFPVAQPHAPTGGTFRPSTPVSNRTRRLAEPPMSNRLNTWLSAAIVALMLVGTVGGAWWFGPGRGGPSGDDGIRLAAVTQNDGTPVASPQGKSSGPMPLMDLLSAVPAEMPGPENGLLTGWVYADVERQLASMGLTSEEAAADPLSVIGTSEFGPIARTSNLFSHSDDEEFIDAIGYNPLTVQQALTTGAVPDVLTVLRGDWDTSTLVSAWEASGYTEYTADNGMTVWTLGADGEVDPEHPIQGRMFQALNNVAILDGGILVYSGTMDTLELALRTHASAVDSSRDDASMAPLLATVPANAVSVTAYDQPGTALYNLEAITRNPNIRPEDQEALLAPFEESRNAVGPMPDYHGMIIGITSENGDEPTSKVFVRLGAGSEEDAAQIATVIEWRWQNFLSQRYQRPLNSVMTLTEATTDGTTVMLTFDPHGNPSIWMDLLLGNDLPVFAVDLQDRGISGTPVATPEG